MKKKIRVVLEIVSTGACDETTVLTEMELDDEELEKFSGHVTAAAENFDSNDCV